MDLYTAMNAVRLQARDILTRKTMKNQIKFDPKKLKKLNNPERLKEIPPNWIWNKLQLNHPQVLVDIGAGTGFFSIPFVEMMEEGKVYACDISATMLDWMRQNVCNKHQNIIPVKMEESSVDLPGQMADLVYMITLHHELTAPIRLLKECQRLLKPQGKIAILDWKKEEMEMGPPLKIRCAPELVESQLEEVGFKSIEIHNDLTKYFLVVAGND